MKALSYFFSFVLITAFFSTMSCKPNDVPEGYIEYQGKNYKEPVTIMYDSDGDGIADSEIGVLGTNLSVSSAPNGAPFYKNPEFDSEISGLVPQGERLCYLNLERYCDTYGSLYAFETSMNTDFSQISEASKTQSVDQNNNGIVDYVEMIREDKIDVLIQNNYAAAALYAKQLLEEAAAPKKISAFVLENALKNALQTALVSALYENNEYVDLGIVQQEIIIATSEALQQLAQETDFAKYIAKEILQNIIFTVAESLANSIVAELAEMVTTAFIAQYNELSTTGNITNIQGICPDGYHIPSDTEWMIFEMALGMSPSDLPRSGVTVTDRGADAGVVQKMISEHGFDYGGYVSINGTYAQLGEAGVYWSSTAGTDAYGDYVWVRQIDTSYTGVLRFKHYEKSGLSIRCFKD
ncbi:MAG: fibrobacter succinogenes major paralogous domain-containing protein [Bacteroidales bacterium]|nr:fibrobacter succinogenes major paralogous domain-containing protein [Bacteroidales bacterium]NLK82192.1 hypothetical protein [Bacteroidales bacterium]